VFEKVLIANRGAIACRIIRTLHRLGVKAVAVYSDVDLDSLHVSAADEAYAIGPAAASESYLNTEKLFAVAARSGATAIHPGYGFLSENAAFAEACEARGIAFIGPTPEQMRRFGLKHVARATAVAAEVPLLPGTGLLADVAEALSAAERIGWPVMLKSTAGGGGIGMRLCRNASELENAYAAVERLARSNFSDGGLYLERFVEAARHIEVQIFGDGQGLVVALGERDCSLQRRNQKVIEETPAPGLSATLREALHAAAVRIARVVDYRGAGTVEFVFDPVRDEFYFLEVNTRLQVEHGVTEELTGIDLVEWMVRLAAGETLPLEQAAARGGSGASIQARIYAENPAAGFQPCAGRLTEVQLPEGVRVETWVQTGTEVPPNYDPLLAKVIVHAPTRSEAIDALRLALAETRLRGLETNTDYLHEVLGSDSFAAVGHSTRWLDSYSYRPRTIDVIDGGTQTTVQDYPGRLGYWAVGVPPSGPMDALTHRLANRLLGNTRDAATLEITLAGPTLVFNAELKVVLAGPEVQAWLDEAPLPLWTVVPVAAGSRLRIGRLSDSGARLYLAVEGGLEVPRYLGSRATFTLGQFGGHAGRTLRVGDVLHPGAAAAASALPGTTLAIADRPEYPRAWRIGVLQGPHAAPDFFTAEDIDMLYATAWEVHYNSSRTGVRLIGPKPSWARSDGGEAGLHPSNIHDNAYAIGSIDFTGDMPILLGPDGPSLGGFVCPACVCQSELWKLGQLRPGDTLHFEGWSAAQAATTEALQEQWIETLIRPAPPAALLATEPAVIAARAAAPEQIAVTYRRSGDRNVLVEYGPQRLDIALRFRVQALMEALEASPLPGVLDLTPGIRSLQVHFDSLRTSTAEVVAGLQQIEIHLPDLATARIPSRIIHLPLSWDDPATRLAIEKYTSSVRPDAPWCPSNIEFIRRINGLADIEEVRRIVFEASYLVLGLGDVYLGAPVATPVDPRHRLVTTKYNPARTWTPENAVGIGGAYLCVYGMEGPGGYQFVGRTLQMWNSHRSTEDFSPGKPWLLRFFDQIRFYPVSEAELLQIRADFPRGRFRLRVESTEFSLADYLAFLAREQSGIEAFKAQQQAAFEAERARWIASGQNEYRSDEGSVSAAADELTLGPGESAVQAHVSGSLWQLPVTCGAVIEAGTLVAVIEAMKTELPVHAPTGGIVRRLLAKPGQAVTAGQPLVVLGETAADA
jgi:urea carboxylase